MSEGVAYVMQTQPIFVPSSTTQIKNIILWQQCMFSHPLCTTPNKIVGSYRLHIFGRIPAVTPVRNWFTVHNLLRLLIIILCFVFFQVVSCSCVVFKGNNYSKSFWVYLIIGGLSVSLIEEGLWEKWKSINTGNFEGEQRLIILLKNLLAPTLRRHILPLP